MNRLKVINLVGARPNFMKIAPVHRRMLGHPAFEPILVHTGQHYDDRMSDAFFRDLDMPSPDLFLGVGSGSHAEQTGRVMERLEPVLEKEKPGLVVVVGDVNSTLAAALTAVKLHIPVAHVEAGLRSFDRSMPEEVNRVVTDSVSDALFVTEQNGMDNLKREGVADEKVHFVGNVMIDSLVGNLGRAGKRGLPDGFPFKNEPFALVTLHRPSNVDDAPRFGAILDAFEEIQTETGVVFPIHPRSLKRLGEFGLLDRIRGMKRVYVCEPLGYLDFLKLMTLAKFVITDSGGIQEETTFLGIPCMTLRENTERPVTVELGTNTLVPLDAKAIVDRARACLNGSKKGSIPPLWDGRASERIVEILGKWADGRTCR